MTRPLYDRETEQEIDRVYGEYHNRSAADERYLWRNLRTPHMPLMRKAYQFTLLGQLS